MSYNSLQSGIMKCAPAEDVNFLLEKVVNGDKDAEERLIEPLYSELRRLAASIMRSERRPQTLQATALVHELLLKVFP